MGDIRPPKPVKLLVGMLAQRPEWLDSAERLLADAFGPVRSGGSVSGAVSSWWK